MKKIKNFLLQMGCLGILVFTILIAALGGIFTSNLAPTLPVWIRITLGIGGGVVIFAVEAFFIYMAIVYLDAQYENHPSPD